MTIKKHKDGYYIATYRCNGIVVNSIGSTRLSCISEALSFIYRNTND